MDIRVHAPPLEVLRSTAPFIQSPRDHCLKVSFRVPDQTGRGEIERPPDHSCVLSLASAGSHIDIYIGEFSSYIYLPNPFRPISGVQLLGICII